MAQPAPRVLWGGLLRYTANRHESPTVSLDGGAGLGLSALEYAQNKPLRVGLIGCGWYGKTDLLRMIQVAPVEVVSLCDVDRTMLAEAAELVASRQASKKQPRTYGDYRKMLAEKDLDAVLVGTPDHWHALTSIAALQSGADWLTSDSSCFRPVRVIR